MAAQSNHANATAQALADADELGVTEGGIVKKYTYLAMALLILAAIVLIFLRFVLYLW